MSRPFAEYEVSCSGMLDRRKTNQSRLSCGSPWAQEYCILSHEFFVSFSSRTAGDVQCCIQLSIAGLRRPPWCTDNLIGSSPAKDNSARDCTLRAADSGQAQRWIEAVNLARERRRSDSHYVPITQARAALECKEQALLKMQSDAKLRAQRSEEEGARRGAATAFLIAWIARQQFKATQASFQQLAEHVLHEAAQPPIEAEEQQETQVEQSAPRGPAADEDCPSSQTVDPNCFASRTEARRQDPETRGLAAALIAAHLSAAWARTQGQILRRWQLQAVGRRRTAEDHERDGTMQPETLQAPRAAESAEDNSACMAAFQSSSRCSCWNGTLILARLVSRRYMSVWMDLSLRTRCPRTVDIAVQTSGAASALCVDAGVQCAPCTREVGVTAASTEDHEQPSSRREITAQEKPEPEVTIGIEIDAKLAKAAAATSQLRYQLADIGHRLQTAARLSPADAQQREPTQQHIQQTLVVAPSMSSEDAFRRRWWRALADVVAGGPEQEEEDEEEDTLSATATGVSSSDSGSHQSAIGLYRYPPRHMILSS
eukprot:TRINITY_DN12212_c0_g1_i2.p1 TRINITY_DN12212_c0_g1~~TRINITY_DN12212_c0_g1_i2.p1  ORF type:complete len:543 (+),score=60.78 TRINITY_DN12212_c0_g1_i2:110-1738(+)